MTTTEPDHDLPFLPYLAPLALFVPPIAVGWIASSFGYSPLWSVAAIVLTPFTIWLVESLAIKIYNIEIDDQ